MTAGTADFLRARGIQPSLQRVLIYEALAATRAHPSAELIHRQLAKSIPTLSRTTVYSTLGLFVEKGVAQELAITGNELRFDADTTAHAHFACGSCGAVSDLGPIAEAAPALPSGFYATSLQFYVRGACQACSSSIGSADGASVAGADAGNAETGATGTAPKRLA